MASSSSFSHSCLASSLLMSSDKSVGGLEAKTNVGTIRVRSHFGGNLERGVRKMMFWRENPL